jgi:dTDP-4-amino-4,6-dideoxygalactose transaminase
VVHLYGNGSDVRAVEHIFEGDECLVIDDAAQAFGTMVNGDLAGSRGDIGLLSFGKTKQITTGGAAVLFKDVDVACELRRRIEGLSVTDPGEARMAADRFRVRFDRARECLLTSGRGSAYAFQDILEGYAQTLVSPLTSEMVSALVLALDYFPEAAEARKAKAKIWRDALAGSVLQPVGMDSSVVPWRYACRLPGATWTSQNEVGDCIRAHGINVSHWYLPGHWLTHGALLEVVGAEKLSREAFQFWVDDSLSLDQVFQQAAQVRSTVDGMILDEVCR